VDLKFPIHIHIRSLSTDFPWMSIHISISTDAYLAYNLSSDSLSSKRPAHAGVKKGSPLKSGYLSAAALSNVKMVADRHRHAAYCITSTGDELLMIVNVDDLDWPWTIKIAVLEFFGRFLAAEECIAMKLMEIDEDYLRTWTAIGSRASHEQLRFPGNFVTIWSKK